MKFGVCTDFSNIDLAAKAGFDYIEVNLSALASMSEEDYQALLNKVPSFPIPALKCNCFLPGNMPITGPSCDEAQLRAYLDKALSRAQAVGIKTAVLGSGGARRVPEGWSHAKAWQQLAAFLTIAAEYAQKYDIQIALEPLQRRECNILNLVSEGLQLSAWVDHPAIGVLGDTHHMVCCDEPWSNLTQAGEKLMHIHISRTLEGCKDRVFPAEDDGAPHAEVIRVLKDMGYQGDVSVEAGTQDFANDCAAAAACLKKFEEE